VRRRLGDQPIRGGDTAASGCDAAGKIHGIRHLSDDLRARQFVHGRTLGVDDRIPDELVKYPVARECRLGFRAVPSG
jgi:hypothetical protein